jgi:glyceraldehyde 3-phosphate dehydrogenase
MNLAPSSTGAAIAVTKIMKNMKGLFDGISIRVPVVTGSLVDITFISKKETSAEEVNKILTDAAKTERWADVFAVTNEPLVSSDIIGNHHASIVDLLMTMKRPFAVILSRMASEERFGYEWEVRGHGPDV